MSNSRKLSWLNTWHRFALEKIFEFENEGQTSFLRKKLDLKWSRREGFSCKRIKNELIPPLERYSEKIPHQTLSRHFWFQYVKVCLLVLFRIASSLLHNFCTVVLEQVQQQANKKKCFDFLLKQVNISSLIIVVAK
jgi:hypothetical protein